MLQGVSLGILRALALLSLLPLRTKCMEGGRSISIVFGAKPNLIKVPVLVQRRGAKSTPQQTLGRGEGTSVVGFYSGGGSDPILPWPPHPTWKIASILRCDRLHLFSPSSPSSLNSQCQQWKRGGGARSALGNSSVRPAVGKAAFARSSPFCPQFFSHLRNRAGTIVYVVCSPQCCTTTSGSCSSIIHLFHILLVLRLLLLQTLISSPRQMLSLLLSPSLGARAVFVRSVGAARNETMV